MSQIILGDVTTGIISLIPNITEEDIKKHTEYENEKEKRKKVRRAFTMPRNPFRMSKRLNKTKDDDNKSVINSSKDINLHETTITDETKNSKRLFRRSSLRKFITRIAQQITSVNISVKPTDTYRVPPFGGYVWPPDQTPGVTGLRNHGNTCFMNAVLQCLSHTDILAEYFVLDLYKADLKKRNKINSRKFGTKGELTEQLALVLKALWTCKYAPEHSTSFKAVVDRYGSQFRSSTQHDAQEFLFWLLDKVHEDLNTANKRKYKTVKNSYGRSDEVIAAETLANHIRCNNSFVQAVFQAQFRSSLACPRCHKQSNTFDPFHCISVQLPQSSDQAVFVTVLYASQHPKQVKLGLGVPPGSQIAALREQLHADTSIIPKRLILAEINDTGFSRVFSDSHQMSSIIETDPIYCIETPPESNDIRNIIICLLNVKRSYNNDIKRFSTPFCIQVTRDISYIELQKFLLKEMSTILKPEVFGYTTPITDMFKIRLQDPSADPDTYLDKNVEHPLFTEMIDLALSILPIDAGPSHVKLLLEWSEPEKFFIDMSDPSVEHESVSQLKEKFTGTSILSLEQCLEHYTKAETLSTEDAWRCPHCQKYLPVVKTLGLWSLPDILVIHFKRFRQQQLKGLQAAKLTTMVKFPIHGFDMSPHLAKTTNSEISVDTPIDDNWSPWKKTRRKNSLQYQQKDSHYDLYAVCYHQGDTLETGHYTAACKNPYDHQWYKFDDQRISHVPEDTVNDEIVNNEAYILFYQRRNLDTMDCSGTSSSSMDHWVSKIAATSIPSNSSSSIIEEKKSHIELNVTAKPVVLGSETKIEKNITIEVTQAIIEPSKLSIENINIEQQNQTEITVDVNVENISEEKIKEDISNAKNIMIPPIAVEETMPIVVDKKEEIICKDEKKIPEECSSLDTEVPKDIPKITNGFEDHVETIKPIVHIKTIPLSDKTLLEQLKFKEDLSRKFSEMVSHHTRHIEANNANRRSFTSTSNYRTKDCDTVSMIRGASSCSKDTLLFIDQQTHSLMEEDETLLGNRSHWISPVTPHKLITISPKN